MSMVLLAHMLWGVGQGGGLGNDSNRDEETEAE